MGAAKSGDAFLGVVLAGTYRVERKLAEGAMGLVYEAVHLRLDAKVAVKTLQRGNGVRPESIERAKREARAMASVVSPHVVRIFDVVPGPDDLPCLVTELLVGEDLGARLTRDRTVAVPDAIRIARATAEGLAEVHRRGVLHRDVKPSNVFLTSDGGVKVIDFGVAKLDEDTGGLTHAGAFLGTPAYMSPEQASSASNVDERSDVYGIGAVLYHMLSGRPPYGELDATQTLMRLLAGEPPRLTVLDGAVPEGLAALVEKAMSRAPSDRHASAAELARALGAFGQGVADPAVEREARWARPSAVAIVLATALLSALWFAALQVELGVMLNAFESWPPWALVLYRTLPAVVLVFGVIAGVRTILSRWRSAPRIQALLVGLRRTVWISAAGLGVFATARIAVGLYPIELPMSDDEIGLGSLVGAVLTAATLAAVGARLSGTGR
jgi:eukaryotic-like serine/threonine-protein kinase